MDFWKPKFEGEEAGTTDTTLGAMVSAGAGLAPMGTEKVSKLVYPVVGDNMRFIVLPYGQLMLIDDHVALKDGQNIIEVKVEATKKVRVSYE